MIEIFLKKNSNKILAEIDYHYKGLKQKLTFMPGMHNIWPAGKMWPAKAFKFGPLR